MRRFWWMLPLLVLALVSAPVVVRSWKTDQQVMQVVDAFCRALRIGDPDAAVELLVPELAESAQDAIGANAKVWRPSPGLTYRVQRLKVRGGEAVADLWIMEGPSRIRPSLKLRQNAAGGWRIARIDGLPKLSREEERETAEKRAENERRERLVMELEQAIRANPGSLVDRPIRPDVPPR